MQICFRQDIIQALFEKIEAYAKLRHKIKWYRAPVYYRPAREKLQLM